MGLVTISGKLETDNSPAKSASSGFIIDVKDYFDSELAVGTSYELVSTTTSAGVGVMWTFIYNTSDTQDVAIRCYLDGTNYVFFPLPAGGLFLVPTSLETNSTTGPQRVSSVHARTLSGTSTLRVIAMFVE